jgi:hypothetical protein
MVQVIMAYVIAVVVATVTGAIASTQFVLGGLQGLGAEVPFNERLQMTLQDIVGIAPIYGGLIAVGFLIAFVAAYLVARILPSALRPVVFAVAGAVAIAVIHLGLNAQFETTLVAGARSWAGYAAQLGAGALGGFAYALVKRER